MMSKSFFLTTLSLVLVLAVVGAVLPASADDASRDERRLEDRGDVPPPPPPAVEMRDHDGPRGRRGPMSRWLGDMREEQPERYRELRELRKNDPEAFREEMRNRVHSVMKKRQQTWHQQFDEELRETVKQYQDAETNEQRDAARAEVRELLASIFDERLQDQEQRLTEMKRRLETIQDALNRRKQSRDEIIETRLDQLLRDPELRWDMSLPEE